MLSHLQPVQEQAEEASVPVALTSFIIPAYNAQATLGRALESLARQTVAAWEAIVVDDGSSDGTAEIAESHASRDARVRLVRRSNGGVSTARNLGVEHARGEWIVFLDSDDAIAPDYLAAVERARAAHPDADVVACGYARTTSSGEVVAEEPRPLGGEDALSVLARHSAGVIHGYCVRRSRVQGAGGFDPTLRTCEDWDLWQRIAAGGARFVEVPSVLAYYRNQPGSLSKNGAQMARDAGVVFRRGMTLLGRTRAGGCIDSAQDSKTWVACWCAGMAAASGVSWAGMLDEIEGRGGDWVAEAVAEGFVIGGDKPLSELAALWGVRRDAVLALLRDIESRTRGGVAARRSLDGVVRYLRQRATRDADTIRGPILRSSGRDALRTLLAGPAEDDPADELAWGPRSSRQTSLPILRDGPSGRRRGLARPAAGVALEMAAGRLRALARRLDRRDDRVGRRATRAAARLASVLQGVTRRFAPPVLDLRDRAPTTRPGDVPPVGSEPSARGAPDPSGGYGEAFWEQVFAAPDPWDYGNTYERVKYERTLELIGPATVDRALELACAEGRFTERLAPLAGHLLAADISASALVRAAERCAAHDNIEFRQLDFFREDISGSYDLIVCSEVLYYLEDKDHLARVARKIAGALAPEGRLVMAHAKLLADDPHETGFEWDHALGARAITEAFSAVPGLHLAAAIETPAYRIDTFRKTDRPLAPSVSRRSLEGRLEPGVARSIVAGGAILTRAEANLTLRASRVPILMYHRVGEPASRFTIAPETLEAQLRFLRRRGFRSVGDEEFLAAHREGNRIAGRPVMLTFDDAYADFADIAWPLLQSYGFTAQVFVVTDRVGGRSDWDGEDAPLMDWATIRRLAAEGVRFGSHLDTHASALGLDSTALFREATRSRERLESELRRPVLSLAYPYGEHEPRVRRIAAHAGYRLGFGTDYGVAGIFDDPMALRRIEIRGGDDLEALAAKIEWKGTPPQDRDRVDPLSGA